jgi:serine/threonine protein kinase
VLIDFGAAIDFHSRGEGFPIIATPQYAPLEQYDPNGPQGPWTDVYALGATIYEMIAGMAPVPSLDREHGSRMLAASRVGQGKYGDRLLGLIDHCLALDWQERPADLQYVIRRLEADQVTAFASIVAAIPQKMLGHFMNWARPNSGLLVDELAAFLICFPIADISWRIGKGSADRATSMRLLRLVPSSVFVYCESALVERGFDGQRQSHGLQFLISASTSMQQPTSWTVRRVNGDTSTYSIKCPAIV